MSISDLGIDDACNLVKFNLQDGIIGTIIFTSQQVFKGHI